MVAVTTSEESLLFVQVSWTVEGVLVALLGDFWLALRSAPAPAVPSSPAPAHPAASVPMIAMAGKTDSLVMFMVIEVRASW
jgi:hypothetical protein